MSSVFDLKKILAVTLSIMAITASFLVAPPLTVMLVLLPLSVFCLPGISIMKRISLHGPVNQALELAAISVSGYFVSALLAIGLLLLFQISTSYALLSPILYYVAVILIRFFRRNKSKDTVSENPAKQDNLTPDDSSRPKTFNFSQTDLWLIVILALLALSVALPPLINIGYKHPEGYYYRAYFNSDYLKHVAVTAHLAHSRIPPDNPYLKSDDSLHYYWFYYVFPASIRSLGVSGVETLDILRVLTVWGIVTFCLLLYGLCRHFTGYKPAAFLAVFCGLFAHSYEGWYFAGLLKQMSLPILENIGRYNIDGMTRWFYGHPQIDCLYRALIFTPQHLFTLMLFCLLLLGLLDLHDAKTRPAAKNLWFLGLLAGMSFGFSSFIGLVVCLWVSLVVAFTSLVKKEFRNAVHVFSALTVSGLCLFGLGIVSRQSESLLFLPHFRAIRKLPFFLFYNYGPLLLVFPLGLLRGFFKKYRTLTINLLVLVALCMFLILYVQIKNFPTDMGIKVGLVLSMVLVLFTVIGLSFHNKYLRFFTLLLMIPIILPAVVTVLLDAYSSSDVTNIRFGSIVLNEDMMASKWIRDNLPRNVRIQTDPFERSESFSLIPTFAERRTTAGDKMHARIFLSDADLFDILDDAVGAVYKTRDPIKAANLMNDLGIDNILIGNVERKLYPGAYETFSNFVPLYRHNRVSIHSNQLLASLGTLELPVSRIEPGKTYHVTHPVTSHDPEISHHFFIQLDLVDDTAEKTYELSKTLITLEPLQTKMIPIEFSVPKDALTFDHIQVNLFHVMDQEDVFFSKEYLLIDGYNTFSTTGSAVFSGELSYVKAEYPERSAGIAAQIRPGLLPEGHYSFYVEYADGCSNMTNGFLKIYSSTQAQPFFEASLFDTDAPLGRSALFEFYLPFSTNLYFELGIDEGGCLAASSLHLGWVSPDHYPFPLSHTRVSCLPARSFGDSSHSPPKNDPLKIER